MNSFKRLSITLTSRMNAMIDQLENHEAVADSVLEDVRRAVQSVRYQIKRIQNEEQQLEKRLDSLQADHGKWKERALRTETGDREKALECVRRMKKIEDEIASTKTQIGEHSDLQRQLNDQLKHIEAKYTELKRKQSLLIGRESRAEAIHQVSLLESDGCCGLHDLPLPAIENPIP